jgi:hydrophobic/amphiphilic exporter-1 (mainly G- bacteria), HAE1 family
MSIASVSIKRPIFMTSVMIAIMIAGWASFKSMSVDLFPDVSIPVITVQTVYRGAGPAEIETLVSRPIEEEISTIAGIKRLTSRNFEGMSLVIVEFESSVDAKYAEQQVRDKINIAEGELPDSAEDSIITKYDPSDTPILFVTLTADLPDAQLYDLADEVIKPRFEQVKNVGSIDLFGGREREIHVVLDRAKLREREISVSQVASQVAVSGENIPSGKVNRGSNELVFRGLGEFNSVQEIKDTLVNLWGNEVPTRVADIGEVHDTLKDETTRGISKGKKVILLKVFRQSGSNTLQVVDSVKKQIGMITEQIKEMDGNPKLEVVLDTSTKIRDNVYDVYETIIIGILLTVITVLFFLGSLKTTLITALSLPISLIGTFILLAFAGFTINLVTLLALTLAVGLLIDDAIVVIENIYRRMELGEDSEVAADRGTGEIQMAVFAITLVVMAVFVPVALMSGTIGKFLKSFGLTVAFSMALSYFVAMTVMPMLTAHFAGEGHSIHAKPGNSLWDKTIGRLIHVFDRFQTWLENKYEAFVKVTLNYSKTTILATFVIFIVSMFTATLVPFEFIPDDDSGQITVTLELAPGASIDGTYKIAEEVDKIIMSNPVVDYTFWNAGNLNNESNKADFTVILKEKRNVTTLAFRKTLREQLAHFSKTANPIVKKFDASGASGGQPITLNLVSPDPKQLEEAANKVIAFMKNDKRYTDVDSNFRTGKPEFQIKVKSGAAKEYGINTSTLGAELRAQVEGVEAAKFRERGREYDVRVRMQEDERDLKTMFNKTWVPNINRKLVRLQDIATGTEVGGPATIERQNRSRYIQITAAPAPGVGLSDIINDVVKFMNEGENKLPQDVRFSFAGEAENMQEMADSTLIAIMAATLMIYLILSSLYESFITPMTIMIALPLAISGAFLGLFLTGKTMNFFVILGLFLLVGVAGKNGILVVDFAKQKMDEGMDRFNALVQAGKTRLRPILMTSFALIAGYVPIVIGLNAASRTRTSMGVALIAGVLLSTVLTLVVVPSVFVYVDNFRIWANKIGSRFTSKKREQPGTNHAKPAHNESSLGLEPAE